jgi:hypothetical protein
LDSFQVTPEVKTTSKATAKNPANMRKSQKKSVEAMKQA